MRILQPRVARLDPRIAATPEKVAERFYLTRPWRQLVERLVALRGRRCEKCGRWPNRVFGDHIVELRDGGAPLDDGNVQLLCGACHTAKTAAVRAARVAAVVEAARHRARQALRGGVV